MELRMATAMILLDFECVHPNGQSNSRVVDNFQDGFTATPGPLELMFIPLPKDP